MNNGGPSRIGILSQYNTVNLEPIAGRVINPTPCRVSRVHFTNVKGLPLYFQIYDRTTNPVPGSSPIYNKYILDLTSYETIFHPESPLYCVTGFVVALSTTPNNFTSPGGAPGLWVAAAWRLA